jgi:hypothetical protein
MIITLMMNSEEKEYRWKNEIYLAKRTVIYLSVFGLLLYVSVLFVSLFLTQGVHYVGFLLPILIALILVGGLFWEDISQRRNDFPKVSKKIEIKGLKRFLFLFLTVYLVCLFIMILYFYYSNYDLFSSIEIWSILNVLLCSIGFVYISYISKNKIENF